MFVEAGHCKTYLQIVVRVRIEVSLMEDSALHTGEQSGLREILFVSGKSVYMLIPVAKPD